VWAHPDDEAYLTAGSWLAPFGTARLRPMRGTTIREIVAEVDPDTILTFGPTG
jgi:LmbE family N-acetylglucosaminyl deacetylase